MNWQLASMKVGCPAAPLKRKVCITPSVPEPEDNKEIPMDVEDPKKKRSSNWDRGSPGSGGPKQSAVGYS